MAEFRPQGGSGHTTGRSHEERDLRVRLVVLFAVALTVVLVGSHFLLHALQSSYSTSENRRDPPRSPVREDRSLPPEPRLETNPREDLKLLRKDEDRRLDSYGWIDRDHRVLRIPIERAMDQVVRRGLPARAPGRSAD